MARPMILMQEYLLSLLWNKYHMGVPVTTIIKQESIPLTPPTLTKLLKHMSLLEQEEMKENPDTYQIIYDSLFPKWLTDRLLDKDDDIKLLTKVATGQLNPAYIEPQILDGDIVTQPKSCFYEGTFPIGKWVYEC